MTTRRARTMRRRTPGPVALLLAVALAASLETPVAQATWSIVLTDDDTGEVAVGTVTCLTSFDLLAIVPVVVVGKGAAAVQASGDFDGIRRPVIFNGLRGDRPPALILQQLAQIGGHQSRQYGIVDTRGGAVTFTGNAALDWAGGVTGQLGSLHYAIQGNILTGACVVDAIEDAVLTTDGDMAARLMAGMEAARAAGGDGRCSCPGDPTGCGCPPVPVTKSGHIGGMIVSRVGDTDDAVCNASGCADGDYFMRLNVPFQSSGSLDPVLQLRAQFDAWRAGNAGRPDAVRSTAAFAPPVIPPNGVATTTMIVTLRDWNGDLVDVTGTVLTVEHAGDSAGESTIGAAAAGGAGTFLVPLIAGRAPGVDRFVVTADDGVRPVVLTPASSFEYFALGDVDGDGQVDFSDLLRVLAAWGPCEACPEDLDGDGDVAFEDLLLLLSAWS